MAFTEATLTKQVDVDGVDVTYFDSTTPGDGGRPLVLIHGTGGSTAAHFGHLFPMIATRTRVISVDWSPVLDGAPLTVEGLARQVRAAVDDALGADALFDLLGYSLGAVVAESLAAQLGRRVEHLILVAGWIKTDLQQRLRNQVWRVLYDTNHDALARYTLFCAVSGPFLQALPPETLDGTLAALSRSEFVKDQMELNAVVDLTEQVEQIAARTLVVSCTEDIMVPPHHQYQLLGAIPDARLTSVTSGHAFFLERAAEVMEITDLFLREPERYAAGTVIPETRS